MAHEQRPPPTDVEFFKIISEMNVGEEKIKLPIGFTRKYGGLLPNPVLLKVPDGTEWRVHWNKERDGGVWLERGWKEFTQYYSLAYGNLLVFKFDIPSSHFEVRIFGLSTLQIDYPLRPTNDDRAPILQNLHVVDVKAEDDPHEGPKFDNKTAAAAAAAADDDDDDDDDDESPTRQEVQVQEDKGKSASHRGRIPRPTKNPSFKVQLRPSYITGRCIAIPHEFATKYLKEGPVRLQVLGGETSWSVTFKCWKGSNRKYKLQRGWSKFRRDNNLKEDDVCVFELTNSTKVTLTVRISRAASC